MKHSRLFTIILVLLFVCVGCASHRWARNDFTYEQFHADSFACEKESVSMVSGGWVWMVPFSGVWMGIANHAKQSSYYERCLLSRGYYVEIVKQK